MATIRPKRATLRRGSLDVWGLRPAVRSDQPGPRVLAGDDPRRVLRDRPHEQAICEAVLHHPAQFPDVHVEPISVGILVKRTRVFCELRPMRRWEAVAFTLTRKRDHPRLARKVIGQGDRFHHVVNVAGPDEVDHLLRE